MAITCIARNVRLWPAQTSGNPPGSKRPQQQPERPASRHPLLSPRRHAGSSPFSPLAPVLLPSLRTGKLFPGYIYHLMAKQSQTIVQAHCCFIPDFICNSIQICRSANIFYRVFTIHMISVTAKHMAGNIPSIHHLTWKQRKA